MFFGRWGPSGSLVDNSGPLSRAYFTTPDRGHWQPQRQSARINRSRPDFPTGNGTQSRCAGAATHDGHDAAVADHVRAGSNLRYSEPHDGHDDILA